MHYAIGAVVAVIACVFVPGVLRKVKARFSAEASKGSRLVEGEIRAAETDVKDEVKTAEADVKKAL